MAVHAMPPLCGRARRYCRSSPAVLVLRSHREGRVPEVRGADPQFNEVGLDGGESDGADEDANEDLAVVVDALQLGRNTLGVQGAVPSGEDCGEADGRVQERNELGHPVIWTILARQIPMAAHGLDHLTKKLQEKTSTSRESGQRSCRKSKHCTPWLTRTSAA